MTDLVLSILLGISVLALSVWSAVVSIKSMPPGENKAPHLWGIILMGFISLALTVATGVKNHSSQEAASRQQFQLSSSLRTTLDQVGQTNALLQESRLSEEFMKGQLNGLSMMVGKIDNSGKASDSDLAKMLLSISRPSFAPAVPQYGSVGLRDMTNGQLRDKALQLAAAIRKVDQDNEADESSSRHLTGEAYMTAYEAGSQRAFARWSPLRGECHLVIDEMLARIPSEFQPKDPMMLSIVRMTIDNGALAGPHPLRDLDGYVQQLAQLLPQEKTPRKRR